MHHLSTPTTPAGIGSDTIIANAVEIDPGFSFTESAALGEAPVVSIMVDDPSAAYDFAGLKRWYVTETACPSGDQLIWNGYINDQTVSRGSGTDQLFALSSQRRWTLDLEEMNAILGFRVITDTDGNRPAETASERLSWLLNASDYLTTVNDNGLVNWTGLDAFAMDANDYRGQFAQDVLSDLAVQSGYIFWAFYDKDADDDSRLSLFFDDPDSRSYTSAIVISNYGDADGLTIFAPSEDTELHRSPDRVAAGVYLPYSGGSVYEYDLATSYEFGFRDRVAPMAEVKTAAKATALALRFLSDNDEQTITVSTSIRMAAADVNDVKRGQVLQARFQHFPDYTSLTYWRVIRKTWAVPENRTQAYYDVALELAPVAGNPSGAAGAGLVGVSYSGTPELPRPTTPGNVLLAIMFAAGNTTRFPTAFRALDSPPVSPATPATPPFSALQTAAWTIIGKATTDYSGQSTGGPCGVGYQGPFHGAAGTCTSGLMVAAAWRYVGASEATTHPTQFSTDILDSQTLTFLWELPTTTPPDGTYVEADGSGGGNPSTATLPTISGNVVAAVNWAFAAGHGATTQPLSPALLSGTTLRGPIKTIPGSHAPTLMNDTTVDSNVQNWGWLITLPTGGIASARVTASAAGGGYNEVNWCGLAVRLPPGVTLPDIPYPSMQTA